MKGKIGKCADCRHGMGAEHRNGELYVWCSCDATYEERAAIRQNYEPLRAYEPRECEDFELDPRRPRIRPEYEAEIDGFTPFERSYEEVEIGEVTFRITGRPGELVIQAVSEPEALL